MIFIIILNTRSTIHRLSQLISCEFSQYYHFIIYLIGVIALQFNIFKPFNKRINLIVSHSNLKLKQQINIQNTKKDSTTYIYC